MDPNAVLTNAEALIEEAEHDLDAFELVEESLRNYHRWRTTGGFEPRGGDVLYNLLRELYGQMTGSATNLPKL